MDINSDKIQQIVQQVLSEMGGAAPKAAAPSANGPIPKTSRAAMLTALEHYDIKEFPIPELGDDDLFRQCDSADPFSRQPAKLPPLMLPEPTWPATSSWTGPWNI